MRSINVKRVAAIATGAAMVGSVLATSALGAVQTSGDVTTFISNIKANLNDVQIAVGTNGAAISDGVQAAKIAAVLASVNYVSAADVTATVTDKKVVVETTGVGGGLEITPSVFTLELAGGVGANYSGTGGFKTDVGNFTLTPIQLSDVLSQTELSAYISGAVQKFKYQEEIYLTGQRYVQYDEAGPNPTGHGLYLNTPYGNIKYKLNFQASGQGPPTNGTAYNEVPEVTFLGQEYALDTAELTNGRLVLYSGAKQEILEGESVQVGDATITITGIGQITSASGTTFTAVTKAEKGGTVQTQSIQRLAGFDFFADLGDDEIVTVYVEEIVYGAMGGSRIIARIGSNRIRFNVGQAFPLDDQWTVDSIDITANAASNGLRSVTIKYGKPTGATNLERGAFLGTVSTGLGQGVQIEGPRDANGDPTFYLELTGYGGATITDTADVTFTGVGLNTSASLTSALQASWTDRDGIFNEFSPTDRSYGNVSATDAGSITLMIGTTPHTIINDKALYLSEITQTTASSTETDYTPKFKIGGLNGFELAATTNRSSAGATSLLNSTLLYSGGVSGTTLTCQLSINASAAMLTVFGTGSVGQGGTGCDLGPDVILLGSKTTFDRASTTTPALNMINSLGGFFVDQTNFFPAAFITDASGGSSTGTLVIYDDTSTASGNTSGVGAGTTSGIKAFNITLSSNVNASAFLTGAPGVTTYIDQSKTTPYEPDYHHTTQGGLVMDGSLVGGLTITIPEAMPSALVKIGSLGVATGPGETTVTEGQTVGNVKIIEIQVTVSGAGAGYYTMQSAVLPESLITWDNAVTKTYTIVVGGPYVNNIAEGMTGASLITQAGAQYLVAEGNRILVAGYLATDTAAAADELVRLLKA